MRVCDNATGAELAHKDVIQRINIQPIASELKVTGGNTMGEPCLSVTMKLGKGKQKQWTQDAGSAQRRRAGKIEEACYIRRD